ncbi:MAG: helix-turn-helix transcriptional regulator [Pirellulales bacterium]
MSRFGDLIKEYRLEAGLSLREFCAQNGLDAGNHSKLERGRFAPPEGDERIRVYAKALGLTPGDDKYMALFDAAAAERGRIPSDIMSDAEVVNKLPLLFRTIRSEQQSGSIDLDKLIERIKGS